MRVTMLLEQVMVVSLGRRSLVPKLGWEQMGRAKWPSSSKQHWSTAAC
jgi:hypothetical protein